uniref:Uncharacterized protein n=1 Tax=Schizaphis graminum TaxID=13262 RepID=A0A2S2PD34_SCHGA
MVKRRAENKMKTEHSDDKRSKRQSGEKSDMVTLRNIIYDYDVIDIIFYRDVLKTKLLYLRKQFINYGVQYMNYIHPLTQLKFSTEHIKEFKPNQNYRLLHLYNSNMLFEIQRLLHLNKSKAFKFCKTLVTSSLTMLCDINLIENLIDNNFQEARIYGSINRCTCCSFYHDIIYTEDSVKDFKRRYPLLTIEQCKQIINTCLIKKIFH